MGARGPIPKPDSVTRHVPKQNPRAFELETEPEVPAFPDGLVHPQTKAWWDSWLASPQTAAFTPTDWQTLVRCAFLVDSFYLGPTAQLAAEIRQVESKLGATVADRDRLGWKVDRPAADEPEPEPKATRADPRAAGPS